MYLCSFRVCQKSAPSRKQIDSMYVLHRVLLSYESIFVTMGRILTGRRIGVYIELLRIIEFILKYCCYVTGQGNAEMESVGIPVGNG